MDIEYAYLAPEKLTKITCHINPLPIHIII